jgi:hypothetical protein
MLFDPPAQDTPLRSLSPQFRPAVDRPGGCYNCQSDMGRLTSGSSRHYPLLAVALWALTTNAAFGSDEQFSLICRYVKQPDASPLVFDVDQRTETVTIPANHSPLTKPPKTVITAREISYREDYKTGWSLTLIDRYTGDGTIFIASKPDAAESDEQPVLIHCTKSPGRAF